MPKLLLIFIGIPFIEMMILIKLGELFGFWAALWLVILTGTAGASLARMEGMRAWTQFQDALRRGEMPGEHLIDAVLILVAGFLLITPGLLTDTVGLLLLIPYPRKLFKQWLRKKFDEMMRNPGPPGSGPGSFRFFIR